LDNVLTEFMKKTSSCHHEFIKKIIVFSLYVHNQPKFSFSRRIKIK